MTFADSLQGYISGAVAKFPGVTSEYLSRLSAFESNNNPTAINGSQRGLYQFAPTTASDFGLTDPTNPETSTYAAAALTSANSLQLQSAFGRSPTEGELYLAHQQGASGAINLLSNPEATASDIVGIAAVTQNGGNANMTASEFSSMVMNKFTGGPDFSEANDYTVARGGVDNPSLSGLWDNIGALFVRGTVIVLGFIFVAIGLSMFRVPVVTQAVDKARGAIR